MKKNKKPRSFLGIAAENIPPAISKLPVLDVKDTSGRTAKVIKPDSKKKMIDLPEDRLDSSKPKESADE